MSNKVPFDLSPSINRLKKVPPPPLSLPAVNTTNDDEHISQFIETTNATIKCNLAAECSHEQIPFVLPVGQRAQILDTLINSSSSLLVQTSTDTKQKRSLNTSQMNYLKQRHASRQGTVTETEWLNFIRFVLHKPFENELRILLDKYKKTYFDRVNSPTTSDATIRAILCDMVSEALVSYSTNSSITDNTPVNVTKRKRHDSNTDTSINNQTKFVISSLIPGKCDHINSITKSTDQHRYKQFQKKYHHLFKYIPDKDEQAYLIRVGHLKNPNISSTHQTNNICLMLYDEILAHMTDDDVELSGISLDNSFTLSEPIFAHIHSSTP